MGLELRMAHPTRTAARNQQQANPHRQPQPFRLRHLTLKNRVMSTAHAPSYVDDGLPRLRYQLYHEEKAKGGLALTMFGGSSSVWTTCMLVFQTLLLAGYAYAHFATQRLGRRGQLVIHLLVLAAAAASLPILPAAAWRPRPSPAFQIPMRECATSWARQGPETWW